MALYVPSFKTVAAVAGLVGVAAAAGDDALPEAGPVADAPEDDAPRAAAPAPGAPPAVEPDTDVEPDAPGPGDGPVTAGASEPPTRAVRALIAAAAWRASASVRP